jgi:hypothetical protein
MDPDRENQGLRQLSTFAINHGKPLAVTGARITSMP